MIINLNISHPPAIRFSPIFTFSRAVLTHTLTLQFLFLSCVCPFFGVYFVFLFMPPSTLDFWFFIIRQHETPTESKSPPLSISARPRGLSHTYRDAFTVIVSTPRVRESVRQTQRWQTALKTARIKWICFPLWPLLLHASLSGCG